MRLLPHKSFCISLLSQTSLLYHRPLRGLAGFFLVSIHRTERGSQFPPVAPIPGPAANCELCWTSPWFLTSAITRLCEDLVARTAGRLDTHRRLTLLRLKSMKSQAAIPGCLLSAKPTISHDTPRKIMLMPTSTPMIVSPDIGSSRQIITPRTMSIAPLSNSQPQPPNW